MSSFWMVVLQAVFVVVASFTVGFLLSLMCRPKRSEEEDADAEAAANPSASITAVKGTVPNSEALGCREGAETQTEAGCDFDLEAGGNSAGDAIHEAAEDFARRADHRDTLAMWNAVETPLATLSLPTIGLAGEADDAAWLESLPNTWHESTTTDSCFGGLKEFSARSSQTF